MYGLTEEFHLFAVPTCRDTLKRPIGHYRKTSGLFQRGIYSLIVVSVAQWVTLTLHGSGAVSHWE